jgi:hypothetical protein
VGSNSDAIEGVAVDYTSMSDLRTERLKERLHSLKLLCKYIEILPVTSICCQTCARKSDEIFFHLALILLDIHSNFGYNITGATT